MLRHIIRFVYRKLTTLNLYESPDPTPDTIRRGILTTRLFLLLISIGTIVLSMGAFLKQNIKNETIQSPTRARFESLIRKYPDTLVCPCSKIAIPFGRFAEVHTSFHQVCSSDFVSQRWIDFIFGANAVSVWVMDVRTSLSSMWQLIASFCESSISSVKSGTEEFKSRLLISSTLMSEEALKTKSNAIQVESKLKMKVDFHASFGIFMIVITISMPMTGLMTNFRMIAPYAWFQHMTYPLIAGVRYVFPETYYNCDCNWAHSCQLPGDLYLYNSWDTGGFYDLNILKPNATIPGLVVNCIPFQGVLNSTLECFFDSDCLQYLTSVYPRSITISPLNKTTSSRFNVTTKISEIFDELFIEDILVATNYTLYYEECNPTHCTFSYPYRFSIIYVITTLIALFGGLSTVLRIVCPYLMDLISFIRRRLLSRADTQQEQGNAISPLRYVKNVILKLKLSLTQLNIFDEHSYEQSQIGIARLFSRFYLFLACCSISVIIFYTFISTEMVTKTKALHSLKQYEDLEQKYKDGLSCPCSSISISYHDLLQIQPVYHQLCHSDFIQDEWINSMVGPPQVYAITDFHALAIPYFSSLGLICNTFQEQLASSIEIFSKTQYVNTHMIPRDLFSSQINSAISDFQKSAKSQFSHSFSMINATLSAEQYASYSRLTLNFLVINGIFQGALMENPFIVFTVSNGDMNDHVARCACVRDTSCTWNWESTGIWLVDGIHIRCNILEMVLGSSLQCLYNTSCVNMLKRNLNALNISFVTNAKPLNDSVPSSFSPYTPVKVMFEEMMVESWKQNSSYEKLHSLCGASYCTYTYQQQFSVVYVIVTLTGLFGGLDLVLRWISLFSMKIVTLTLLILRRRAQAVPHSAQEIVNNQGVLPNENNTWMLLKTKLISLNWFRNQSTSIVHQRNTTRLYILMLLICLSTIIIYTAKSEESVIKVVTSPSEREYEDLFLLYNVKLSCPCSKISIPYGNFISVSSTLHQVCTSDFVDDPWINFLYGNGFWGYRHILDIRARGAAHFTLLSVLCLSSQTSINKARKEFLEMIWINAQPISRTDFKLQTDAIISRFLTITNSNIGRNLHMMHSYLYSNSLLSGYLLNWAMWINDLNNLVPPILTSPNQFTNSTCSCATRSNCREPVGIYVPSEGAFCWIIPGIYVGCSVYASLMQSTLECFYSRECVSQLVTYITTAESVSTASANNKTFLELDSTRPSHYRVNASVRELVDELFVEEWITNASYSAFYSQCNPIQCSYPIRRPSSLLFIVSRILGLYGGITLALRMIIPSVVLAYVMARGRIFRNRITPSSQGRT